MKKTIWISGMTAAAIAIGSLAFVTDAEAKAGKRGDRPSFSELDTSGDGLITRDEIAARGAERFASRDTNGDGALSRDELLAAGREGAEERVNRLFERADANGDGLIQESEIGNNRGSRIFDRLDTNGDGAISEEEFAAAKPRRGDRGASE